MAYCLRKYIVLFSMQQLVQLRERLMRLSVCPIFFSLSRNTAELVQSINGHTTNYVSGTLMTSLQSLQMALLLLY